MRKGRSVKEGASEWRRRQKVAAESFKVILKVNTVQVGSSYYIFYIAPSTGERRASRDDNLFHFRLLYMKNISFSTGKKCESPLACVSLFLF